MTESPLPVIHKALQSNVDHQAALHRHAERLTSEIAQLDKLHGEANVNDDEYDLTELPGIHVPNALRPTSLIPPTAFIQAESPFSEEALKRNRYLEYTTVRPFQAKEIQALSKAVYQEKSRTQYMLDHGMPLDNPRDGGINWNSVAEKVSDVTQGIRRPHECRVKWLGDQQPDVNHGKWPHVEREKLIKIHAEYTNNYPNIPIDWTKVASELGTKRPPIDCMRELNKSSIHFSWTPEKDKKLQEACRMYGTNNWYPVARYVSNTVTLDQCKKRYRFVLDPSLSRQPWSNEEDDRLAIGVEIYGQAWADTVTLLPGRSSDSCRNRWRKISSQYTWTKEEDEQLLVLAKEYDNEWNKIASELDTGKQEREVSKRFEFLSRVPKPSTRERTGPAGRFAMVSEAGVLQLDGLRGTPSANPNGSVAPESELQTNNSLAPSEKDDAPPTPIPIARAEPLETPKVRPKPKPKPRPRTKKAATATAVPQPNEGSSLAQSFPSAARPRTISSSATEEQRPAKRSRKAPAEEKSDETMTIMPVAKEGESVLPPQRSRSGRSLRPTVRYTSTQKK